jgi:hypothetical protein
VGLDLLARADDDDAGGWLYGFDPRYPLQQLPEVAVVPRTEPAAQRSGDVTPPRRGGGGRPDRGQREHRDTEHDQDKNDHPSNLPTRNSIRCVAPLSLYVARSLKATAMARVAMTTTATTCRRPLHPLGDRLIAQDEEILRFPKNFAQVPGAQCR